MSTITNPFVASALRTIDIEREAIQELSHYIDEGFIRACELIMENQGRVIVTGMGKSGHIGKKIAATLASTGTPAFYVHPGEASHGDLGMITNSDIVLALSNSGTTREILTVLPLIKRLGCPLIAMTGDPLSELSQTADANLNVSVKQEACPLGLAPTSSTTATLVMGDALAVALLEAKGFSREDFAFSHPGGALGRKLLLKVSDLMHSKDRLPLVTEQTSVADALMEITNKGMGMTTVVDADNRLSGIFTDGDLRRSLEQDINFKNTIIRDVMTTNCTVIEKDILAAEALRIMEEKKINGLVIVDKNHCPVGALNMHDLLQTGVL